MTPMKHPMHRRNPRYNGTARDRWAKGPVPAKDWKVQRVIDYGPGERFRYRVQGVNLNYAPDDIDYKFSWRVPDIDDPRFDLSTATFMRHGEEAHGEAYSRRRVGRYRPNPDDDERDQRWVDFYDGEALDLMQGWWGSQDDPLYAIYSSGGNYAWVFEDAISNLDRDIRRVKPLGRGKYQLGRGTFSEQEIGELHTIRDALAEALREAR